MDEQRILKKIIRGSERALEAAMAQYSSYVVAVIHNRSRGYLSPEDEEEAASDVFYALWQHAGEISPGCLRSWLGSVARNKAIDKLRRKKVELPLEETTVVLDNPQWELVRQKEQARQLAQALEQLRPQDREIFFRYYQLCQTASEIARDLDMSPSTVRSRLSRGRQVLRAVLCQGGNESCV